MSMIITEYPYRIYSSMVSGSSGFYSSKMNSSDTIFVRIVQDRMKLKSVMIFTMRVRSERYGFMRTVDIAEIKKTNATVTHTTCYE